MKTLQMVKHLLRLVMEWATGELAHQESSEALKILRCLLSFNIPIKTAIQTLQQLKTTFQCERKILFVRYLYD